MTNRKIKPDKGAMYGKPDNTKGMTGKPYEGDEFEKQSYSADEVRAMIDERVKEALSGAQSEWETRLNSEKEEAVRLASMSAEERAQVEMNKRQKAFDDERSRFMAERMEFHAAKKLGEQGMPVTFAGVLKGADEEETERNIETFKKEFLRSVEAALADRLKGKTPRTGSAEQSYSADPFLRGLMG